MVGVTFFEMCRLDKTRSTNQFFNRWAVGPTRGVSVVFPNAMRWMLYDALCRLKVMVDLLLLFGGYATVFLVSPKRNVAGGVFGAVLGSPARSPLIGRGMPKVGRLRGFGACGFHDPD